MMLGTIQRRYPPIVLVALVLAAVAINSLSGAFVYVQVNQAVQASQPPLLIWPPQHGQLSFTLGPNMTSIETNVTLAGQAQLLNNPELLENPDSWFCIKSTTAYTCRFLPSDTGAVGGVEQIYLPQATSTQSYAGIAQLFVSPDNASSVEVSVRYSAPSLPTGFLVLNYIVIAVYWWNGTGWQQIGSTLTVIRGPTRTYTYYNATISLTNPLKPLNFYIVAVVYYLYPLTTPFGAVDFRIDSVRVNMTPTRAPLAFAGEVFRLNTTVTEYAHIRIVAVNASQGVNADIYWTNESTYALIAAVRNGTLAYYRTYVLAINPSGDSMNASGRLIVAANATQAGAYLEIRGLVYYTNGVYHVTYPFVLRVRG